MTDAKIMSESVSKTNLDNDTITYVISGSTSNTLVDTSEIKFSIPSEYLVNYSKYSTTATVPLASSLTSSVMAIPDAAEWCFINPYVDWSNFYYITLSGSTTYKGTASITVTGDTFKASNSTGTITPTFTFYDANKNVTSDITCSAIWSADADASTGTLSYQIQAAKNSSSNGYTYYALVTFDKSTLTNNEITPVTANTYGFMVIGKEEQNIRIGTGASISEKSNTTISSGTEIGTFTITLPETLGIQLSGLKIYGNIDSSSDYFTIAYYGTAFAGTDLASGTGMTITGRISTDSANATTATVTLYASSTTKPNAESAKLVSGTAAPLYLTLTDAGISAFNLDSGIEKEFCIGTLTLTDN